MTEAFDAYAASRPKPTTGPTNSYIGYMFMLMRHDDAHGHTAFRDEIAAHLKRRAGGEAGQNDD